MKLVVNLLRVSARHLLALAIISVDILHVDQKVAELNLGLRHLLFCGTKPTVFIKLAVKVIIVSNFFLLSFFIRILALYESLLILLSEVDLINKLLVHFIHVPQLLLQLVQEGVTLVVSHLTAQPLHNLEALAETGFVRIRHRVHLSLQLSEVVVVARSLLVVFVHSNGVVLLLLLTLDLDLIDALLVGVELVGQVFVLRFLHLEDEVELAVLGVEILAQLDWQFLLMSLITALELAVAKLVGHWLNKGHSSTLLVEIEIAAGALQV